MIRLGYRSEGSSQPLVRDYQSIANADEIQVRVPSKLYLTKSNVPCIRAYRLVSLHCLFISIEKIATPVKVEQKVWLANERTWISYLSITILMSTLSLGLWNAAEPGSVGRWMGGVYAGM
jgi:hypothetical protein